MASAAARASRCAPSPTPARRRSTAKPSSRSTDREKSMTRLAGKVALISGSSRGIGRALALKLARDGARIVVNDLDEEPEAEVVRTNKEFGGDAVACVGNVTDADFGDRFLETGIQTFNGLDFLVCKAKSEEH